MREDPEYVEEMETVHDRLRKELDETQRRLEQRAQDVIGLRAERGELLARLVRLNDEAMHVATLRRKGLTLVYYDGGAIETGWYVTHVGWRDMAGFRRYDSAEEALAAYKESNDAKP